jgi:hypothetical protein
MTKVGFTCTVVIQKQSNNRRRGSAHDHQNQERSAGAEFDRARAIFFSFFAVKGIGPCEFVRPNISVNSKFECDVLRRSRQMYDEKIGNLANRNWLLHHGNMPARTSLRSTEFVNNSNMVIVLYPPYSTDLTACDFALFPKLKMNLKGQCFERVIDI